MGFLTTTKIDQAEGLVLEQYESDLESKGYVTNYTQVFSLRPEVYEFWRGLIKSIQANMMLRRYELVTLAAAMALECSY